ncbi:MULTISPECIES: transposase [Acinetobacter]|mgnify:FL=1|uniref:transposase n=1 Tax=Acinetobacter TaxID=469 RepID=UPI000B3BF896|nr:MULTISPECIES: transposase [Acinetobacter]AWA48134.1 transposase [Acinetobacter junii]MBL8280378.1 transposase [Acinetobacter junii]MBY3626927.1 transposase [Acinetobacter sp. CUI P1]MDI6622431.1 transposase [Acinetobacter junii]
MKIINEWHIATATNGNEINVQIIPLKRQQSTLNGFKWVEVGKKILLQSGQEIDFNLDGRSFYTSPNQLYRLN